eukprot:scaffold33881_cov54-Phaeocystis_antarctica.AAC.1
MCVCACAALCGGRGAAGAAVAACSSGPASGASAGTKSSSKSGMASLTCSGLGYVSGLGSGLGSGLDLREAGTRLGVRCVLAKEQRLHQRAERVAQPEQRQLLVLLAEQRAGCVKLVADLGDGLAVVEVDRVRRGDDEVAALRQLLEKVPVRHLRRRRHRHASEEVHHRTRPALLRPQHLAAAALLPLERHADARAGAAHRARAAAADALQRRSGME